MVASQGLLRPRLTSCTKGERDRLTIIGPWTWVDTRPIWISPRLPVPCTRMETWTSPPNMTTSRTVKCSATSGTSTILYRPRIRFTGWIRVQSSRRRITINFRISWDHRSIGGRWSRATSADASSANSRKRCKATKVAISFKIRYRPCLWGHYLKLRSVIQTTKW